MTWRDFTVLAWSQFNVNGCRCGKEKRKRQALCPQCYATCPMGLRAALRQAEGYVRAYWRALKYLGLLTEEEKALESEVLAS
jgi:hypothetical protein